MAQRELVRIWQYNANDRSERQADAWNAFLRAKIDSLATGYAEGRPIDNAPELRHVFAKKRNRAHGHIIIYGIDEAAKAVNILHVFHTRQDYQGRLGD
jgi:plasmid stabilization system protein ParE